VAPNVLKGFSMTKRELYRDKYQAMIHQWTLELEALSAEQDRLTAEAKLAAQPHLETVSRGLEQARAKLIELAEITDDKWDEVVAGADRWWEDTKAALEGAFDVLRPGPSTPSKKERS
jgi:hypothetical protein